jgi:hypothetical protein
MPASRYLSGLITIAFAACLYGQAVNGSLVGTVTDASGAVMPDAKVTILEVNTGASRSTATTESGNYVLPDLPPGTYTVTVTQKGFKQVTRERIDVLVNTTVRVDLAVPIGDVSEIVTVAANAPLLQTDRADTGRKNRNSSSRGDAVRDKPEFSEPDQPGAGSDARLQRALAIF